MDDSTLHVAAMLLWGFNNKTVPISRQTTCTQVSLSSQDSSSVSSRWAKCPKTCIKNTSSGVTGGLGQRSSTCRLIGPAIPLALASQRQSEPDLEETKLGSTHHGSRDHEYQQLLWVSNGPAGVLRCNQDDKVPAHAGHPCKTVRKQRQTDETPLQVNSGCKAS